MAIVDGTHNLRLAMIRAAKCPASAALPSRLSTISRLSVSSGRFLFPPELFVLRGGDVAKMLLWL